MPQDTDPQIAAIAEEATAWRRHLHANPELSFDEVQTSDFVAEKLASWGIAVTRGIAGTGLVGTLQGKRQGSNAGRAIGLRADMDALPILEETGVPYASTKPGVMHACGHDGHTAMLLGAARYLSETRDFEGTVHFIFQPAEEKGGGGRVMVEEGLFQRFPCDAVYGIHNGSNVPKGQFIITRGTTNAAADTVTLKVRGLGGHAARPHQALDPVLVASHIVVALQSVVSRRVDPLDSAVLSLCSIHGGSACNVIPEEVVIEGTVRTLRPETRDAMQRLLTEVATATATAHGASVEILYERGYPPVVNSDGPVERAQLAAAKLAGEERVVKNSPPTMGGEDFSYMALAVPGCFIRLGQAEEGKPNFSTHHPRYNFNDAILPMGIAFWSSLVEQELAPAE
ncbi:M20 aminoacylase family protein [Teichococcus cervicalis]|uniref:Amidohydrolase n=1 Tax=Pseudoroseomonas cervicalis ATCC 49957 TaxID=525371 RepID=D5RJ44_9PROT|nr:M20 aminoacylase family protein [Pseudoroseomonas cervicalis]EFH12673.1 amidohydrolase [Pseudoroseomonas cervicalis ATCC 49957]